MGFFLFGIIGSAIFVGIGLLLGVPEMVVGALVVALLWTLVSGFCEVVERF